MTARLRRRIKPASPDPDHEVMKEISTRIGIKHEPEKIAAVLAAAEKHTHWMPDTPTALPMPEFIHQDVLQREIPLLIHGPDKTLKTTIAIHLGVSIAAGVDLFSHFGVRKEFCGPVLLWMAEGGSNYVIRTLDAICSVYGVKRKDLPVELHTDQVPIDSTMFLYTLAARVQALQPALVFVEPLYMMSPSNWDGRNATTFNVGPFTALCEGVHAVPGLGHHDKRGDASSALQQSIGAGPSMWMGQWMHVERYGGDWDGHSEHQLTVAYGGRGVGGGKFGLQVDDATAKATVVGVEELIDNRVDQRTKRKRPTAYDYATDIIDTCLTPGEEVAVGELAKRFHDNVLKHCGVEIAVMTFRKLVIPQLEQDGVLVSVTVTGNQHTVGLAP